MLTIIDQFYYWFLACTIVLCDRLKFSVSQIYVFIHHPLDEVNTFHAFIKILTYFFSIVNFSFRLPCVGRGKHFSRVYQNFKYQNMHVKHHNLQICIQQTSLLISHHFNSNLLLISIDQPHNFQLFLLTISPQNRLHHFHIICLQYGSL